MQTQEDVQSEPYSAYAMYYILTREIESVKHNGMSSIKHMTKLTMCHWHVQHKAQDQAHNVSMAYLANCIGPTLQ